ncbi:MAG: hypothetical protein JSU63_06200 [Phycisphaerales bacterium]|nr:MAG: hypothetical protein JSU63_06200 [Phycisphaerales bacterium]
MFSTVLRGFLGVLVMSAIVAAGTPATPQLTDEEASLLDWASGFQARARVICGRISVPARHVAEDRIAQAVHDVAATRREHLDVSLSTLGQLADHGQVPHMVPAGWGPALEREVSLRQNQLLRAWSQAQEEHSPERVVAEARAKERELDDLTLEWRERILRNETRLARMERAKREKALKGIARKYAINWLLAGHPDAYVPVTWARTVKKSEIPPLALAAAEVNEQSASRDFEDLRQQVRHLTDVLVSVGLGDYSAQHVVQVERQLVQKCRTQAQGLLASLTGEHLWGSEVRFAAAGG